MWTCGIAIATQQATPATQSSACAAFIDRPNGTRRRRRRAAAPRRCRGRERGRPAAHEERQRRHDDGAEHAQADVGLAPADGLDEVLDDRRPDRAGDVVAAGADRDRDAAPAHEPERGVGDQRREASPSCRPAPISTPWTMREGPDAGREPGGDEADAEPGRADQQRHHDAAPVGEPPHQHAADAEADHQQRVGQRGVGARDAELGLHRAAARRRRRTSRCCRPSSERARRPGAPQA